MLTFFFFFLMWMNATPIDYEDPCINEEKEKLIKLNGKPCYDFYFL